jgi:hypothetical protein
MCLKVKSQLRMSNTSIRIMTHLRQAHEPI